MANATFTDILSGTWTAPDILSTSRAVGSTITIPGTTTQGVVVAYDQNTLSLLVHDENGDLVRVSEKDLVSRPTPPMSSEEKLKSIVSKSIQRRSQELNGEIYRSVEKIGKYKQDIKRFQKDVSDLKKRKSQVLVNIDQEIKTLMDHPMMDDMTVTKNGNMVLRTKRLVRISPDGTPCRDNKDLGRYDIGLDWDEQSIYVNGIDYIYDGTTHPHIDKSTDLPCWGSYDEPIKKLFMEFKLHLMFDGIVNFLSTLPQEGGRPYVSYETWLRDRKRNTLDPKEFTNNL